MKGAGEILAREVIPQRSRVIQLVFSASGKRRISAPTIGIRVALGARRSDVLGLVLKEALRMTAVGVGLGLAGAFAATRVLRSLLFEVKPTDPATFVCLSLSLTLVALLASYIPARRATKVDPLVALRYEIDILYRHSCPLEQLPPPAVGVLIFNWTFNTGLVASDTFSLFITYVLKTGCFMANL